MKSWRASAIALVLAALATQTATAFEADGCEKQRAQFPKRWSDVGKEKLLFTCMAADKATLGVRMGPMDGKCRTLISVTATPGERGDDQPKGIYRAWLDREQTGRLKQGEYFATVVRSEKACWIRSLDDESLSLFIDNGRPGADLVPRVSLFAGAAYRCAKAKAAPPVLPAASCEQQRAQYPKDWQDASQDKALFQCAQRGENWRVRLGEPNAAGHSMMTVIGMRSGNAEIGLREEPSSGVHRAWLDADQVKRLKDGRYFATAVRDEDACWSVGILKNGQLFFMDAADPPQDRKDAGNFYNKAPRFGVFGGDHMHCQPVAGEGKPD